MNEREQWLQRRRASIGSSDAASVCGLPTAYGTPLHVFADKVYGVRTEETDEMRIGTMMEPVVAEMYRRRVCPGCEILKPMSMRNTAHPWQSANIDFIRDDDRAVEIKTSGTRKGWGPDGTDDVPPHYFVQVTHQMCVRPAESMDLAALLCGNDLRVYEIRFDAELAASITQMEADFWGLIEAGTPPDPDYNHAKTLELMAKLNTPIQGLRIEAEPDFELRATRYQELSREISDLKKQQEALKAQLIHAMGVTAEVSLPGGLIVRRKPIHRKAYSVAATTYVDFRICKDKGEEE